MQCFVLLITLSIACKCVNGEIKNSAFMNKLTQYKPVGGITKFMPLTELPPPELPRGGRRHMDDCRHIATENHVKEGGKVVLTGDYYDDGLEKKVVTVRIPEHIDRKHFEVTESVPYLTVGEIEAIGYHPSTKKVSECERIYQEHMADLYTDETIEQSEESLEMARVILDPNLIVEAEQDPERYYEDLIA